MTSKTETETENRFWSFPKPKNRFYRKNPVLETLCGFHHDRMGCKIRHGISLQQVGPKPLIQAAVTGKCSKLSVALIIVCLDFARPLSLPHQHSALIRLVYGYVLAVGIG